MASLVLLSGGMDSTVALFHSLEQGHDAPIHALTFHYGQRHATEVKAASDVFHIAGLHHKRRIGEHLLINLTGVMPLVGSLMLADVSVKDYSDNTLHASHDPAFIPYRNLLFITVAAQWARFLGARFIVTGIRGGFSDCTPEFEVVVQAALRMSDANHRATVSSPVHRSRSSTVELASRLPGCMEALARTVTCFRGTNPPCGRCLPCVKRAQGFAAAGVHDPVLGLEPKSIIGDPRAEGYQHSCDDAGSGP